MPRYFFHTEDGRLIEDEQGSELPDLQAARVAAQRLTAEMLRDLGDFWRYRAFRVSVRDDAGQHLFSIDVTTDEGPASP